MKKMMERFKNQRGLTLVELLAVIVILAIVAVIAFVMIGNIIENSKKDAHIANAQQIISAAKLYDTAEQSIDSNGVDQKALDKYVGELHSPWDDDDDYGASYTVTKDEENVFSISGFNGKKCILGEVSEKDLAEKGRDLCNNTGGGGGGQG